MEDQDTERFDPTDLPLGALAAVDVSDEPMWTFDESRPEGSPEENLLSVEQKDAILAMVGHCAQGETQARRMEVEGAWKARLMDRGFHYVYPYQNGGWLLTNPSGGAKDSPYASADRKSQWPLNLYGCANDILVSSLTRETPRCEFLPKLPNDDGSITSADAKNKYKYFFADDNQLDERCAEIARYFCTDDRVAILTRPVADAQAWGYEDDTPPVVPETEGIADEGGEITPPQKRPKIREVMSVYGKLEHKRAIVTTSNKKSPYDQIYEELHVATLRAMYPWVADKISGGDNGFAEVILDRMARCSIKLALRGTFSTGDSLLQDCTLLRSWHRPEMYMDDSCPKKLRGFFYQTFPKGFLGVMAGKTFVMARSENIDQVLTITHARSGSGQNRRSLTEAYMGPNLRLNNWNELLNKYMVNGIPRTYLNEKAFNIPAIKAQESNPHAIDGFNPEAANITSPDQLAFTPQRQPTPAELPAAIQYFAGDLMEQLTGAQPAISGSEDENNPETLGQSRLQNAQAMGRLGEPYKALRLAVCSATSQAAEWAPKIQPEGMEADRIIGGKRLRYKVSELAGDTLCVPNGDSNIPEAWEQREQRWLSMVTQAVNNPVFAPIVMNPVNAAVFKQFYPDGTYIPGVDAVEKQQGEFEILLETAPQPNPQYVQLQMLLQQGKQEAEQLAATGQPMDPQKAQALQQAEQMLSSIPPEISSVPLMPSDNDQVEALVCNIWLNSSEGRRMAKSPRLKDQAAYKNVQTHWQQHAERAKQQAMANQQPVPPKTSITIAADKLNPEAQTAALAKAGIATSPEAVNSNLQPHETIIEQEHIDPFTGSKTKIRQAAMNPEH